MTAMTAEITRLYDPIRPDLTEVERVFDDELSTEAPFIDDLCETIRSYRGKMLRPALLLLVGKALGPPTRSHHILAAVVEMVHMATLVHDDVLDGAELRRKRPTIARLSGNVGAVLFGDYLISHAFHLCSSLNSQHASRRIGAATNVVCEGELLQNYRRGDARLDESSYLKMIRMKTGSLTGVAAELGAWASDADSAVIQAMQNFGQAAGVAFQIVDDVLDVVGTGDQMGKTLGRDAALGKLTLPAICALSRPDSDTAQFIRSELANPQNLDAERWAAVLSESGGIEYALSVAREFVADALRHLSVLPNGEARQSLTALTEFILARRN